MSPSLNVRASVATAGSVALEVHESAEKLYSRTVVPNAAYIRLLSSPIAPTVNMPEPPEAAVV